MTNLHEQLSKDPLTLDCVAMVCNTTANNIGFKITLREIPAIAEPFTIGEAATAYLKHLIAQFDSALHE
jgi:hypothetical protein